MIQRLVLIDGLLNKTFVKNKQIEKVKFDELFSLIFSKMGHMHQIKKIFGDKVEQDPIIKKGKFHPIEFKLESRGGNKKVTNVYNLNEFKIDSNYLQSFLRKEIGCSVSISEALGAAPSSNEFVLSIQGNQIYHVSEILKSKARIFYLILRLKLFTLRRVWHSTKTYDWSRKGCKTLDKSIFFSIKFLIFKCFFFFFFFKSIFPFKF